MMRSLRLSSEVLRDRFREPAITPAFLLETSAFFFGTLFLPFPLFFGPTTVSGAGEGASDKGEDARERAGLSFLSAAAGVSSLGPGSTISDI